MKPRGARVGGRYPTIPQSPGKFDFVLANPPFNVNAMDKERLKDSVGPGRRFPFGLPRADNANYLWIQLFNALQFPCPTPAALGYAALDGRGGSELFLQKPWKRIGMYGCRS